MSGELPPWRGDIYGEEADFTDGELSLEHSALNIERRLTRRQKLRRGGVVVLVVMAAAFFLLGGPSSSLSWLASLRTQVSRPAPSPRAAKKLANNLPSMLVPPPGVQNTLAFKLAPANGPDGYVYSCWTDLQANGENVVHSLHVGVYTQVGRAWAEPPAPVSMAATCAIVPDREHEAGVLLAVWPTSLATPANSCLLPELFHSDDAGHSWRKIPWPATIQPTCDPVFYLEAGRLYVQSPTPLLPKSILAQSSAAGLLLTTDISTILWRSADNGQANDTAFRLIGLRPAGRLLAESLQGNGAIYQAGFLWESDDAGLHWRLSAPLPGDAPVVSVSSDPQATDHGGWGYVYVSYLQWGLGTGPALSYGTLDTHGTSWISLTQPQGADLFAGGPMVAYLSDGAEGPLESLIYLGTEDTGPRVLTPQYVPWLWDTAEKAWRQDPVPLPADSVPQGVSWWGGDMTLIVSVVRPGVDPYFQTFSMTLTTFQLLTAY
jgi:hypothetical protein